jgi:hypothetical protein
MATTHFAGVNIKLQDLIFFCVQQSVVIIWPSILASVSLSCESLFVNDFAHSVSIKKYLMSLNLVEQQKTDRICRFDGEAVYLSIKQ